MNTRPPIADLVRMFLTGKPDGIPIGALCHAFGRVEVARRVERGMRWLIETYSLPRAWWKG